MQLRTGWTVLLFCEKESRKILFHFPFFVRVSALYDQTGSCSHYGRRAYVYGNMTVTGNVQHVSQKCSRARGEGVLERRPPSAAGLC